MTEKVKYHHLISDLNDMLKNDQKSIELLTDRNTELETKVRDLIERNTQLGTRVRSDTLTFESSCGRIEKANSKLKCDNQQLRIHMKELTKEKELLENQVAEIKNQKKKSKYYYKAKVLELQIENNELVDDIQDLNETVEKLLEGDFDD